MSAGSIVEDSDALLRQHLLVTRREIFAEFNNETALGPLERSILRTTMSTSPLSIGCIVVIGREIIVNRLAEHYKVLRVNSPENIKLLSFEELDHIVIDEEFCQTASWRRCVMEDGTLSGELAELVDAAFARRVRPVIWSTRIGAEALLHVDGASYLPSAIYANSPTTSSRVPELYAILNSLEIAR